MIDALGEESRAHFQALCDGLTALGIPYTINPVLVRGLDYYGHTVFEWVTRHLGSQATVCAGGRYDLLVEQLGGTSTAAVGFALGIERIILLMETLQCPTKLSFKPTVFMMATNSEALVRIQQLAETIRDTHPEIKVLVNTTLSSLKSQFKKADKSAAHYAMVLGEDEFNKGNLTIKDLRSNGEQITVAQKDINDFIQKITSN